jgi:hypothetical protein
MRTFFIFGFVSLSLAAGACCHTNRLAQGLTGGQTLSGVALELSTDPFQELHFTRKISRRAKQMVGSAIGSSRQVLKYRDLLQELGGARLRPHLLDQLQAVLKRHLAWESDGDDAVLSVDIEEMVFSAKDSETPVTLLWRMNISLREAGRDQLLWADCPEWTQELGALSMHRILAMGPEERDTFMRDLARGLAEYVARRLVADGAKRLGERG